MKTENDILNEIQHFDLNDNNLIIQDDITKSDFKFIIVDSYLKSILLPDSYTVILEKESFYCLKLKEIKLAKDIEIIKEKAFYECDILEEVYLPRSLKKIEDYAFAGCKSIKKLRIPRNVTEISMNAFYGSYIEKLIIESSLSLPSDILAEICTSSRGTIQIYNEVLYIKDFLNADNIIMKYKLEEKIVTIQKKELEKLIKCLPIPKRCFFDICLSEESSEYRFSARDMCMSRVSKKIAYSDFFKKYELYEYQKDINYELEIDYDNRILVSVNKIDDEDTNCNNVVVIPEGIMEIGENCFKNFPDFTEIVIPVSVNKIGAFAFEGCNKLEKVDNNDNSIVKIPLKICEFAFRNCISLKEITIPYRVTYIAEDAFCGCDHLEKILIKSNMDNTKFLDNIPSLKFIFHQKDGALIIKDGVTSIMGYEKIIDNVGIENHEIRSIQFPNSLTSIIGDRHFANSEICTLIIPNNVNQIAPSAFEGCKQLTTITIYDNLKVIEQRLFADCINLENIKLPRNLEEIKNMAFDNCKALESINLPKRVKRIENAAFNGCDKLKEIRFNSSIGINLQDLIEFILENKNIENIFVNDYKITNKNKLIIKYELLKLIKEEIKNTIIFKLSEQEIVLNNNEITKLIKKINLEDDIEKQINDIINNYIVSKQRSLKEIVERHRTILDDKSKEEVLEYLNNYQIKPINDNIYFDEELEMFSDYISNKLLEINFMMEDNDLDFIKIKEILNKTQYVSFKEKILSKLSFKDNNYTTIDVLNTLDKFIDNKTKSYKLQTENMLFLQKFIKLYIQKLNELLNYLNSCEINNDNLLFDLQMKQSISSLNKKIVLMMEQYEKINIMTNVLVIMNSHLKDIKEELLINGLNNNSSLAIKDDSTLLKNVSMILDNMKNDINDNKESEHKKLLLK